MAARSANSDELRFSDSVISSFEASCERILKKDGARRLAALWLLTDHVLLTFQQPVYVNISLRRGSAFEPIYSNLSEADRQFLGINPPQKDLCASDSFNILDCLGKSQIRVDVRFLPQPNSPKNQTKPSGMSLDVSTRTVRELLAESRHRKLVIEALESVQLTDRAGAEPLPSLYIEQPLPTIDLDANYHRPLKQRVAAILDEQGECLFTQTGRGAGLNLFAVYRHPFGERIVSPPNGAHDIERLPVEYDYSLGLLLSRRQRDIVGEEIAEAASMPLEFGERSIADTPMAGGNVDFSLPSERSKSNPFRRDYHASPSERSLQRRDAEIKLFSKVFGSQKQRGNSIFYVPIHMGGRPWISIFRFDANEDVSTRYARNILFYRDIVPTIAAELSRGMQDAYADAVAGLISHAHQKFGGVREKVIASANQELLALTTVYPYEGVKVSDQPTTGDNPTMKLEGPGQALFMNFTDAAPALPVRLLDRPAVVNSTQRMLDRLALGQAAAHQEMLSTFGHFIGGMLQRSGFGALEDSVQKILDRHDPESAKALSNSVSYLKTRLSVIWGVSEATRMRKTAGRGFPLQWFGDDGPASAGPGDIAEAVSKIAMFYLWPRWELDPNLSQVGLEIMGNKQILTKSDALRILGDGELTCLPPFTGKKANTDIGYAGTIAVSLGMAELIFNAVASVSRDLSRLLSRGDCQQIDQPILSLSVHLGRTGDSNADEYVKLSIHNWAMNKPNRAPVRAVLEIQELEKRFMHEGGVPIVVTTAPIVERELPVVGADISYWVSASWTYFFNRVHIADA